MYVCMYVCMYVFLQATARGFKKGHLPNVYTCIRKKERGSSTQHSCETVSLHNFSYGKGTTVNHGEGVRFLMRFEAEEKTWLSRGLSRCVNRWPCFSHATSLLRTSASLRSLPIWRSFLHFSQDLSCLTIPITPTNIPRLRLLLFFFRLRLLL